MSCMPELTVKQNKQTKRSEKELATSGEAVLEPLFGGRVG